jgi:DNA-binding response OmpR family regulator
MTVLIADSSTQITNRLESLVLEADNKLETFKALNFSEALRMFKTYKPDVVLLDLHLPDNKSFDLLKQMKTNEHTTYIIALSIHGQVNTREHCIQVGADYCLDKYNEFHKIPGIIKALYSKSIFN